MQASMHVTEMGADECTSLSLSRQPHVHKSMQGLFTIEQVYMEGLHLQLNTGNTWLDGIRNGLQYLLTPELELRDVAAHPPDTWTRACSGTCQAIEWVNAGWNFEKEYLRAFRISHKPLQGLHGSQVQTIFSNVDVVLTVLEPAFSVLRTSTRNEVAAFPVHATSVLRGLAVVHRAVDSAAPRMNELEAALPALLASQKWFHEHAWLPVRVSEKFYDHAVRHHLIDQLKRLSEKQLSLASLSSRFLEHLNKTVKKIVAPLHGGGRWCEGGRHLVVVQGFRKLFSFVRQMRVFDYADMLIPRKLIRQTNAVAGAVQSSIELVGEAASLSEAVTELAAEAGQAVAGFAAGIVAAVQGAEQAGQGLAIAALGAGHAAMAAPQAVTGSPPARAHAVAIATRGAAMVVHGAAQAVAGLQMSTAGVAVARSSREAGVQVGGRAANLLLRVRDRMVANVQHNS